MKLYKFDYRGTIGNNVITVPTDSQFLIGISNGDATAEIKLFDGEIEIEPMEDKIGAYTCFRFETDGTPKFMHYKAVISETGYEVKIDILVISQKMTVAYRDLEGGGGGSDIEVVTTIDSESTDEQVPSAKCVYDIVGDVETLINNI